MDVEAVLSELLPQIQRMYSQDGFTTGFLLLWLEDDDRLGMTRFEDGNVELVRRRRLGLDLVQSRLAFILG